MKQCAVLVPSILAAFVLFVPITASAADDPATPTTTAVAGETADGLFYEARALMSQDKWAEACPKLEQSLRLGGGIGTEFNLADCNDHVGKIATAWVGFKEVATQARATGQPGREKLARERADALEPRLPMLVIEVRSVIPQLAVKRDGVLIEPSAWNTSIPVDPGTHRIVVSAPGRRPWETTVESAEGIRARVPIPNDLALDTVATTTPPVDSTTATSGRAATDMSKDFPPAIIEGGATQRTVGWIIAGVGAAGIGTGAGFGLVSMRKRDEARDHCAGDQCDPTGLKRRNEALQMGTTASITAIAGGAMVLGGLIVVLTAPKSKRARVGGVHAIPNASLVGGGVTLQGAF